MIIFETTRLKLEADSSLKQFKFLQNGKTVISDGKVPLFNVAFLDNKGERIKFSAFDANKVEITEKGEDYCELTFKDFHNYSLKITVKIILLEYDRVSFKADVECATLQLEWLELPAISVKDTFGDNGNSSILLPYNEGVLIKDIDFRDGHGFGYKEPDYPSCGNYTMYPGMLSSPFIGVVSDFGGIYLGAHDKQNNTLHIDFKREGEDIRLVMRVYPGITGGNYSMDFDIVLAVFEGDWHDCADIYKKWFSENKTQSFKKIEENDRLPDWYSKSPLILAYAVRGHHDTDLMRENNFFPYSNALPVIDDYAQKTDSNIMALLMHWEGTAPWAPPYVWPPYGGEKILKDFIDELHKKGHCLGLYCSGLGYTINSQIDNYKMHDAFERDNVIDAVCDSPNNGAPVSVICSCQREGYDLCPAHPFTKNTICREAESMLNAGTDYIQLLDQNHGGTPYFCYSKNHGHPPVPGKWESEALKDMLNTIESKGFDQKYLLGCESAASEVFIPQLLLSDNRYELNYLLGEPVPLYAYLYHSYVNNFMGNQVIGDGVFNCDECKDNLLYRLAYSFTAGDFLTLVINDEGRIQWSWGQSNFSNARMPDMDDTLSFVKNLNSWRKGESKKYLLSGDMIKPLKITEMEDHKILCGRRWLKVPTVMTSMFKASDGSCGQIFSNYTKKPQTITVEGVKGASLYSNPDLSSGSVLENNNITVPPLSAVLVIK